MGSINRRKLAESVIEEIKERIEAGELKEGDKLPNQHAFAAELGVSRTVLREALQTLAIIGVIEQQPKSGTVIRASAPLYYAGHLSHPAMADDRAVVDLIEARRYIEIGAAELAASRAEDRHIREMGALVEAMEGLVKAGDLRGYTDKNVAFHFVIAEGSGNPTMSHLLATLRGSMEEWMLGSIQVLPGLLERSFRSHRAIYQAIRQRNPKRAALAMRRHIGDLQESFEAHCRKGETREQGARRLSRFRAPARGQEAEKAC